MRLMYVFQNPEVDFLHWQPYRMKRRLSVTNLSSENNLPTFRLNAPVVIRAKDR